MRFQEHLLHSPIEHIASPEGKFLGFTKESLERPIVFIALATEPMFPGCDVSTKTILIKLLCKLICLLSPFPLQ
jgi:hypothetical protein